MSDFARSGGPSDRKAELRRVCVTPRIFFEGIFGSKTDSSLGFPTRKYPEFRHAKAL